jgi:hypothetical protein
MWCGRNIFLTDIRDFAGIAAAWSDRYGEAGPIVLASDLIDKPVAVPWWNGLLLRLVE